MKVKRSLGCCAIYELYDLDYLVQKPTYSPFAGTPSPTAHTGSKDQWDRAIKSVLDTAKRSGGRYLPRVIIFSDADRYHAATSNGECWYNHLRSRKHKVTKKSLGHNPKSGNNVTMYHWYPEEA